MPLIINTNTGSLNAQRYLANNTQSLSRTLERLASGYRINRAGDDAAGLQISETLRAQIRGSKKALDNVQDGINVLNIADGAFDTVESNLQRIRELTVQAANDTNATAQRTAINNEINQLLSDITRIANATQFNGVNLVGVGSAANFMIEVGPGTSNANDVINIGGALGDITTANTGINLANANITNNTTAQTYLTSVDAAMSTLNTKRATLGSYVNRLESAANNLSISIENLSSSESRIRNADIASESADLTRNQILQQASATVLAQANQTPSLALQLLQN